MTLPGIHCDKAAANQGGFSLIHKIVLPRGIRESYQLRSKTRPVDKTMGGKRYQAVGTDPVH